MKTQSFLRVLGLLAIVIFIFSCQDKCYYYVEVVEQEEILVDASDVKNSFKVESDFQVNKPGLIYTYNNLLLVGEAGQGVHILDNSNPSVPKPLKFIRLKGNENISVANNMAYFDNGPDLIYVDISDINNIRLNGRIENAIPGRSRAGGKVFAGMSSRKVKKKVSCDYQQNNRQFNQTSQAFPSTNLSLSSTGSSSGIAGSMSRFAILGNYLYLTYDNRLTPIDISSVSTPVLKPAVQLNSNAVETIFPYKNYLYFGTANGVLIYDCMTSPQSPAYLNTLNHIVGCDPVFVEDDYAFSTVRGGTQCRNPGVSGLLNIYNVANPVGQIEPEKIYSMIEPFGLAVENKLLIVCQGLNGLFVYDWDKTDCKITLRHSYPDIHAFDVILDGRTMIVTADNGLFQFDYSNPDAIKYLSTVYEN